MKLENIKLSIGQTKNPQFFQLSFHVSDEKAAEAKLSHGGRAFCVTSKDELKALMGIGFRPFSLANIEVELREQDNIDPTKPSLIKFDILGAQFRGGMGDWNEILNAPVPEKEKPEGTPGF